ncbi:TPA: hypothetical protein NJY08_004770 [Salmonella enterica subsp. enterica serovar Typhi str. AG3]|nr:hypothetical protein [Salmonella enterica subsp. enterica serovar Typhi str. AG3]
MSILSRQQSTINYKSVLTTLPVTPLRKLNYHLEFNHSNSIMNELAEKYINKTGITITKDYTLHIFHIDEIIEWEQTKDRMGPFFTQLKTDGIEDPFQHISKLLVTGRGHKNIIVIEVDDKMKLDKIQDDTLKFAITSETIFID